MSSQDVQSLVFFGKKRWFFFEKILQLFKKTQHWYFASVSDLKVFLAYAISKRSNLEFFRKNDVFFRKNFAKFQWDSTWTLCFGKRSKSFSGLCNLKTFKSWVFLEKWCFSLEKIFENFQEHYAWHFWSRMRFRFSSCWGILKTVNVLVFFGEKDLVFEKILDFFQNRKTSHLFSSLRLK